MKRSLTCWKVPLYHYTNTCQCLLLLFSLFVSGVAFGQSREITGTVISEESTPLPGVNVLVKGTSNGTITDIDGNYSLSVPEGKDTLVFSFIGLVPREMTIGNKQSLNVTLLSDTKQLSELVVTALGFEEDVDKMGSTSAKISTDDMIRSGETGVINGMAGKAAGVLITRSAGDPGASSYIQIRGQSTITGPNQPLIIVDGIPISNSSLGQGAAGVTQQSRLNDINPEDIASMQILKGASAAALWGSRAANGVIVITTKSGSNSDKLNISFSSTVSFDRPNVLHPLQNNYGQGTGGLYNPSASGSWGDRIDARAGGEDEVDMTGEFFEAYNGERYYPIITKNATDTYQEEHYDEVFRTGSYVDNFLSLSGGNEDGNFFLSVGDLRQKGIIKGQSDYKRSTIRFNSERRFGSIVTAKTNATYTKTSSNRIQRSNSVNGLYIGLLRTPPDFDNSGYIGNYYASPTASPILNRQRTFRRYLGNNANPIYNNPLWAINELTNSTDVDRFIVSSEIVISPTSWFDLTARGGIDFYTDDRITYYPVSSATQNGMGSLTDETYRERQLNFDLIGRVNRNFGDLSTTLIGGFNINDRNYRHIGGDMNNFIIPDGPLNFSNASLQNKNPFNEIQNRRTARLYATLNLGYKDALFINLAGAAESSSTFGSETNSTFLYPSADIAWQFTQLSSLADKSFLSFGKLRASYGVVGVQPEPYRTITTYENASFSSWGGPLSGTGYGNGAFVRNSLQADPNLRPERKTEWEVGADLRFFNDRLSLTATYYQNYINDLLLDVSVAGSTGYTQRYTNAGSMQNRGGELDMSYLVLQKGDFSWSINANWNRNKNEVTNLAGTETITLGGFSSTMSTVAKEGYPLSVLYSGVYERNTDGSLALDENGFFQLASSFGVVGDPNPDWRGGIGTSLLYKNLSLNVLFETFQGADFAAGTQAVLYHFGTHEDVGNEVTPDQDVVNYAGQVFPAGVPVRGNLADFGGGEVLLDETFYTSIGGGFGSLQEQFIKDGSWTRLRELSLGYSLNSQRFREKTKLQSINFTVTGRNLFLWTKVVGIDPETNLTGSGIGRGQDYFNSPNAKSLLFSVKINY